MVANIGREELRAPGLRNRTILQAGRRCRRRFEGRGRPGFDRPVFERRTMVIAQRFTEGMNRR